MASTNVTSDDAMNIVRNYSGRNPWHEYRPRASLRESQANMDTTTVPPNNGTSAISTTPNPPNNTTDATLSLADDTFWDWEHIDYLRYILIILIGFFLLSVATLIVLHIRQGKSRESRRSSSSAPIVELKYERMQMQIEMYPITPVTVPPVITYY